MQGEAILTSIIEVGIGIAGFSSIVVTLTRSTITDKVKVAFLQIWIQSAAIILFSAIPLLLGTTEVDPPNIYVISSFLYGFFLVIIMTFGPMRKRLKDHPILMIGYTFPVIVLANAVFFGLAWPYISILLAGILLAFLSFYQLITNMWSSDEVA
jgi:hypothetical protein